MSFCSGFHKEANFNEAMAGSTLGGLASGYYSGRSAAGTAANALSAKGYKTKNEETARNVAKLTGALGAVGGLALGLKHKEKAVQLLSKYISNHPEMHNIYHLAVPFAAATGGGMVAGGATGAVTALRGALSKKNKDKK